MHDEILSRQHTLEYTSTYTFVAPFSCQVTTTVHSLKGKSIVQGKHFRALWTRMLFRSLANVQNNVIVPFARENVQMCLAKAQVGMKRWGTFIAGKATEVMP